MMRWTMFVAILLRTIQGAVIVMLTLLLPLTPLLHGCMAESDLGNAEQPLPSTESMAPIATITFPGSAALLTSGHVTVHETARGEHAIIRVEVNGLAATSTDGFTTWERENSPRGRTP